MVSGYPVPYTTRSRLSDATLIQSLRTAKRAKRDVPYVKACACYFGLSDSTVLVHSKYLLYLHLDEVTLLLLAWTTIARAVRVEKRCVKPSTHPKRDEMPVLPSTSWTIERMHPGNGIFGKGHSIGRIKVTPSVPVPRTWGERLRAIIMAGLRSYFSR